MGEEALSLHDFTARTIEGDRRPLSDYRGQVVLVVNTATRCGLATQLEELEDLQRTFGPRGFTVLGFPCDQFLGQELPLDEQVEELCRSLFEVTFPLFARVRVNGPDADPMWQWLQAQKAGVIGGRISWNFTKFLIGPEGQVVRRYAPPLPPRRIARRIDMMLTDLEAGRPTD
nr:glutathione peroxidase [Brachybacterium sillae]